MAGLHHICELVTSIFGAVLVLPTIKFKFSADFCVIYSMRSYPPTPFGLVIFAPLSLRVLESNCAKYCTNQLKI